MQDGDTDRYEQNVQFLPVKDNLKSRRITLSPMRQQAGMRGIRVSARDLLSTTLLQLFAKYTLTHRVIRRATKEWRVVDLSSPSSQLGRKRPAEIGNSGQKLSS